MNLGGGGRPRDHRERDLEDDRGRPAHRPAEIEDADLAPLALELAAWGVREPGRLGLPTQPPPAHFAQAQRLLHELGLTTLPAAEEGVFSVEIPLSDLESGAHAPGLLPSLPSLPAMLERFLAAAAAGLVLVRRAVERWAPDRAGTTGPEPRPTKTD